MPHLKTITLPDGITYDIDTQYTAGDGLVINGQDNEISVLYGSTANTACEGNDPRLSDARNAKDVYSWAKEPLKPTYTSSEVGAIDSTLKGSVNGVAELDENGLVPASQLPSYVDDVVEGYYYNNNFYKESTHETLIVGESGKIYLDLTENITYRWGGSSWVKMSSPLALGETSSTAYRGDRGKYAYDHASDSGRLTTATNLGMYKISSTAEGHIGSLSPITTQDLDQKLYQWVTQADYDALTPEEQMNGIHYLIDAPSTTDNLLWAKVGYDVLTTTAQNLSAAINEHEEDISELNSSLETTNTNLNNLSKLFVGSLNDNGSITLEPKGGSHLLILSRANNNVYCGLVFDYWGADIKVAFGTLPSNLMVGKNASTNNVSITNHLGFTVAYTLV